MAARSAEHRRRLVRARAARPRHTGLGLRGPGHLARPDPGHGRPELVRAVLEGVAHRGADLLEAAESDSGLDIASLRIDGGMSDNDVFVEALADAIGRPVEISPVVEATTLGAGFLAGMAVGLWADESDVAAAFSPRAVVRAHHDRGGERGLRRERWLTARGRAEQTIPELSGIDF